MLSYWTKSEPAWFRSDTMGKPYWVAPIEIGEGRVGEIYGTTKEGAELRRDFVLACINHVIEEENDELTTSTDPGRATLSLPAQD